MKEDFLHYIWRYKKFDFTNLKTASNKLITIVNVGQYTQLAGPDFFNAQVIIGGQKWAGNIEIHVNSSDWFVHNHQNNPNYDTIILHVVWNYDVPLFDKNNQEIEVLEIKHYVASTELKKYQNLVQPKSYIFCENQINTIDGFIWTNWVERLFFERLERKTQQILTLLKETNNDWEAVLFYQLAKNFGLNANGDAFFQIAKSIGFNIIRKESLEVLYLEALLLGQANAIPITPQDNYVKELQSWHLYLSQKYQLQSIPEMQLQFFKHRPDNFPTIRLAQLAAIYAAQTNVFSKVQSFSKKEQFYEFFDCSMSDYWINHYQLDKVSVTKNKKISTKFVDLLVINTIIPILFAYHQKHNLEKSENLLALIQSIPSEKNTIVEKFNQLGVSCKSALNSQALIQLKTQYCDKQKCLQCAIGVDLLK